MAQVFFGQWGNSFSGTTHADRPSQEQGRSEVTEIAAKDAQQKAEEQRAEKQRAEKVARETLGQWANAFKSMPPLERPGQEQSGPVGIEPATNGAQKVTEPAAKDIEKAEKIAKEKQKSTETAAFPVEGYDEMNVGEVSERLDGLSEAELKRVGKYEKDNKDRGTLRKEMEQKTETTS
jgi:LysM repeat protein